MSHLDDAPLSENPDHARTPRMQGATKNQWSRVAHQAPMVPDEQPLSDDQVASMLQMVKTTEADPAAPRVEDSAAFKALDEQGLTSEDRAQLLELEALQRQGLESGQKYVTFTATENALSPDLDAKMAGFEDAACMFVSQEAWDKLKAYDGYQGPYDQNEGQALWHPTAEWYKTSPLTKGAWRGPPTPMPDVLLQPPVVPEHRKGELERLYLEGVAQWWFQIGMGWVGVTHPGPHNAGLIEWAMRALAVEHLPVEHPDIFNRLVKDIPIYQLPELGEWDVILLKFSEERLNQALFTQWTEAVAIHDALERKHLYVLAFIRGALHASRLNPALG